MVRCLPLNPEDRGDVFLRKVGLFFRTTLRCNSVLKLELERGIIFAFRPSSIPTQVQAPFRFVSKVTDAASGEKARDRKWSSSGSRSSTCRARTGSGCVQCSNSSMFLCSLCYGKYWFQLHWPIRRRCDGLAGRDCSVGLRPPPPPRPVLSTARHRQLSFCQQFLDNSMNTRRFIIVTINFQ
jgi:hypothetical protein